MIRPRKKQSVDKTEERTIYWLSFGIRCIFGLSAWWISRYTSLSLVNDAMLYEEMGARIAQEWLAGGPSQTLELWMESGMRAWVIVYVLAVFSFILRGARVLPLVIFFYTLITAWTPVLTFRIARQLGISLTGTLWATRLIMFSPVFSFWAGALYKEGLILLALNLIVFHILLLQQSVQRRSVLILAASIVVLTGLRFYLPGLLFPAIAIGLILAKRIPEREDKSRKPGTLFFRQVLVLSALIVTLVFFGFTSHLEKILPDDIDGFLSQVQTSRNDLSSATSGFLFGENVSTPGAALRFLPIGTTYFLTVPLPWHFGSLRQNLVIPEMIFWLSLYPSIFMGMKVGLQRNFKGTIVLLSITLAIICLYGLFIGNAGTAYRLRSQVWLFWALFAGWSKSERCRADAARTASTKPAGAGHKIGQTA